MRSVLALAGTLSALVLTAASAKHSFTVVPGQSFGPIRQSTTRADLDRLFGKPSVVDGELAFPEAQCTTGTRVYPDTPNEIEIGWADQQRTRVAFARTDGPGNWATPTGIHIGTTLDQLMRLSRKPLTFLGFGSGQSGRMSWTEGSGSMELYLLSHMDNLPAGAMSDQPVRAGLPGLRPGQLKVARLSQTWHEPWEFHDCHY